MNVGGVTEVLNGLLDMIPASKLTANASLFDASRLSTAMGLASEGSANGVGEVIRPVSSGVISCVGHAAVLGGAAVVYSAVARSPRSTLEPLSIFYMLLLALQYSIQPRVSKAFIDPRVNKRTVAIVEEVTKSCMATALFTSIHCGDQGDMTQQISSHPSLTTLATCVRAAFSNTLQNWTISSSLLVAGLPAALYAVQGVLSYTSYQNLDSVTFNGLSQTKTLSAALCCYLILGKPQSPLQIVALAFLFLSSLIFQNIVEIRVRKKVSDGGGCDVSTSYGNDVAKPNNQRNYFALGIVPCLGASFLSGLSGALSQKGLQMTGGDGRDPYFYTIEVSVFSALFLLLSTVMRRQTPIPKENATESDGPFRFWTWKALIPITIKAFGGVLTALVHKHSGSVVKGFSMMLGLVIAGFTQALLDGRELSPNQIIGTLMVMFSGWLHFTNPP